MLLLNKDIVQVDYLRNRLLNAATICQLAKVSLTQEMKWLTLASKITVTGRINCPSFLHLRHYVNIIHTVKVQNKNVRFSLT